MGIFKNITRTLKQAAPLIGSAIGMYLGGPAGMAALGGALGGGIGSLVGGGDTEDALIAAGLGGLGGYMAQGSFNTANAVPPGRTAVGSTVSQNTGAADFAATKSIPKFVPSEDPGIFSKIGTFAKENPFTTAGIAGLGLTALGGLGEEEKKAETTMQPYPEGKSRLGMGRIGNKFYNLDDEDERRQYFEDLRNRNKDKDKEDDEVGIMTVAAGGEVNGPGTGTSDSVPARLSDGEFVLTAKAVRGAGGGDRDLGAARMYDMMSELERVA